MTCSTKQCLKECLLKSDKCYEHFILALQDKNTYQTWMTEYWYSFVKIRDPTITLEVLHRCNRSKPQIPS